MSTQRTESNESKTGYLKKISMFFQGNKFDGRLTLIMLMSLLFLLLSSSVAANKVKYSRPKFDKTPHKKTVWMHVNSWFEPNKDRVDALGGPDTAARHYQSDSQWGVALDEVSKYGVTGYQFEVSLFSRPQDNRRIIGRVLDSLKRQKSDAKIVLYIPVHVPDSKGRMEKLFAEVEDYLKNHPNYYRLNGSPVIVIYRYWKQTPKSMHEIIANAEARFGHMIWLIEAMMATPEMLRKFMPVADGLTMYGNWSLTNQQKIFDKVAPVMHKEFPDKIFEAGVQNNYSNHFHYGGVAPRLMDKYLASWKTALEAQPDSIAITNFFDHYENSHHLPSWAWEDLLMKISQYYIAIWRGQPPPKTPPKQRPEVFVVNTANAVIGQTAAFDLISFPSVSGRPVTVDFAITDATGKTLKDFGKVTLATNKLDIKRFNIPTLEFADVRALFPKVRWLIFGKGTNLVPGIRPWMLYFASSTANTIKVLKSSVKTEKTYQWRMNGQSYGSTIDYPDDGQVNIACYTMLQYGDGKQFAASGSARLLRNGREFARFASSGNLSFTRLVEIPNPGAGLDWYNLEFENKHGKRVTLLPIWVRNKNRRPGKVTLPVYDTAKKEVVSIQIDADRIPFFYYKCNTNDGMLLRDSSGYRHHGFIKGVSFEGGHLQQYGFRHEHNGPVPPQTPNNPEFMRDPDGCGFYRFKGPKGYIRIMGGTMPPYASTVEFSVRVAKYSEAGIFGTANQQLSIGLTADGRIKAYKGKATEGMGGTKATSGKEAQVVSGQPIPLNKWVRVTAVYNLKNFSLYIDGKLQGSAPFTPRPGHEWFNTVVIGAYGKFPYGLERGNYFEGDITNIRIYGRNLNPTEFLK